jgi:hypothetical protein
MWLVGGGSVVERYMPSAAGSDITPHEIEYTNQKSILCSHSCTFNLRCPMHSSAFFCGTTNPTAMAGFDESYEQGR